MIREEKRGGGHSVNCAHAAFALLSCKKMGESYKDSPMVGVE